MTTQVLAPLRRQAVLRAAQGAIDALIRDLTREEQEKAARAGASVLALPICKRYQTQAALEREHVFRLLRNRSPRVVHDVRRRLETLRREIRHHQAHLEPHYRKDHERDLHLADEYWRCALAHFDLRRALDEDWQFIDDCVRAQEEVEAARPSERQWLRSLPPEERKLRLERWKEGMGESYVPAFTPTERAQYLCLHAAKLLAECCPPLPRPDPVVSEWEAARVAARHGIALDEARRLLWKSEKLLEPELLEE
ncbi:MAG: hypothetical protein C0405_12160 [Desulfovibrio sp.]|nr:hypothetical protein [Desulfovibrio sp.]